MEFVYFSIKRKPIRIGAGSSRGYGRSARWNNREGHTRSGIRQRLFHVPSAESAFDVLLGTYRETLHRLSSGNLPKHIEHVTTISLQALGVEPARILEIMRLPLPKTSFASVGTAK